MYVSRITGLATWTWRGSVGHTGRSAKISADSSGGGSPPPLCWAAVSGRGLAVILPKDRDPRFVTIRRGGTLTDADPRLLALWAAACAEHVLDLFAAARPEDSRPRRAIAESRAWARGEITMTQARTAAGHAMGAARDLSGAARHAAYATGQAAAVAHVAAHELGAAAYAIKAARAAASAGGSATSSRRRFARSSSTTSGCGTPSVGQCSTAERVSGLRRRMTVGGRDWSVGTLP